VLTCVPTTAGPARRVIIVASTSERSSDNAEQHDACCDMQLQSHEFHLDAAIRIAGKSTKQRPSLA
jgi:hypothetical protein